MRNLTLTADGLRDFLTSHREWLLNEGNKTFYLLSNEIQVDAIAEELRIKFLSDQGVRSLEFRSLKIQESSLLIEAEGGKRNTRKIVEFVPRLKASDLRESTKNARLNAVNEIAAKFSRQINKFRPLRVALNEQNGRFAEITAQCGLNYVGVLADVSGAVQREAMLSKAFAWFRILNARKNRKISEVWIVADRKEASGLGALIGCLKTRDSAPLTVWKPRNTGSEEENRVYFEKNEPRTFNSLWSGGLPRLSLLEKKNPSAFASGLLKLWPDVIDLVNTAQGETLRFRGLPFARSRIMTGNERIWFGAEREKAILDDATVPEFENLVDSLSINRRFDAPNKQHEFYRAAPEAWLESILRRNIKTLDANLILSPIYNQFRAAREKIDLLALRKDGRLVIIELKIAQDRDMVFQAVDYWRRVESQRRRGKLDDLELFGEKKIANRPTVVYLVAPTLGFHIDLEAFARSVRDEIEIYRFDLAENWREEVKVLRRRKMGE